MWLSPLKQSDEAWIPWESLTLVYPYTILLGKIANSLVPYAGAVRRYSAVAERSIQPIEGNLEQPEILKQNVALLKNAIEFWRTANRVSDSIAPILVHYSWHCFNSFFIYSMFRWKPYHTKSHGIITILGDELSDVKIRISRNGLFDRLMDTWTLMGVPLAFSRFWPIQKNGKIEFMPNNKYLPDQNNQITLEQLLEFDSWQFQKAVDSKGKNYLIRGPYLPVPVALFNRFVQAYLIIFAASNIARYRPVLWQSILIGGTAEESEFALRSSKAAFDLILGPHDDDAFVPQVARIFDSMEKGTFVLTGEDGKGIN